MCAGIRGSQICCGAGLMLAAISCATPAFAFDAADALRTASGFSRDLAHAARAWIDQGYRAAPALMLGLAFCAAIPVLAVAARTKAFAVRDRAATRRYRAFLHRDAEAKIANSAIEKPSFAFLEALGPNGARYAIARDMLRIGREDDNDIRIPSKAIHRYHAAIYREAFDDWHIADLSGAGGNGIAVNGQRCSDARLHDGDVIDLGPGKLRFRALAASF